jgi:malate dehydrogenase (quinone)
MKTDLLSESLYKNPDVVLIGGGIMSATLGVMLKQLDPELTIQILERLPQVAHESSDACNNAGTGHAALCELNYTPEMADGNIDISKAVQITQRFQRSKQFWSYLVEQGIIPDPTTFIHPLPHMSFVRGIEDQAFLQKRHQAMTKSHFFSSMEFATDHATIESWAPLLTQGRPPSEALAATRVEGGTDLNFGALTRQMIDYLVSMDGVKLALDTRVVDLQREGNGRWQVRLAVQKPVDSPKSNCGPSERAPETKQAFGHAMNGKSSAEISAGFVFIGAGGGALPLLQKSGIPEGRGYGGFPVSGQFLGCHNLEIIESHSAKVYGKAGPDTPPMSVPHLDTRIIDGHKTLLFGPFAGFTPKFLKAGSNLDMFRSIKPDNLLPILGVGINNLPLVNYLLREILQNHSRRCESLRDFFPAAINEDWTLYTAGQRVQIIKKDSKKLGKLEFGTEVVASADGSLAAVLGASPGASTSPDIILDVLKKCFPTAMASAAWKPQLEKMVPAYGLDLEKDAEAFKEFATRADALLQL